LKIGVCDMQVDGDRRRQTTTAHSYWQRVSMRDDDVYLSVVVLSQILTVQSALHVMKI